MKKLFIVLMTTTVFMLHSISLDELIKASLNKELSLEIWEKDGDILRAGRQKEDLKSGWGLSLSTGKTTFGMNELTAAPSLILSLPWPAKTGITLEAPLTASTDNGEIMTIKSRMALEQPLNDLLGLTKKDNLKQVTRLKEDFEQSRNRRNLINDAALTLMGNLKKLVILEKEKLAGESEILDKQLQKDTAVQFGTLKSGTEADMLLEMELNRLKRKRILNEQNREEVLRKIESITGVYLTELPLLDPLTLPHFPVEQEGADLIAKRMELRIGEVELNKQMESPQAQYSLNGEVTGEGNRTGREALNWSDPAAGVSFTRRGESVDLSTGISINRDSFSLKGRLSWKTTDSRGKEISEELARLNLQRRELLLRDALPRDQQQKQAFMRKIQNLEERQRAMEEDRLLGLRRREEQQYAWEKGFINGTSWKKTLIEREILDFDEVLLNLESRILQSEINKYFYTSEEHK